jgi:hypothetical protein
MKWAVPFNRGSSNQFIAIKIFGRPTADFRMHTILRIQHLNRSPISRFRIQVSVKPIEKRLIKMLTPGFLLSQILKYQPFPRARFLDILHLNKQLLVTVQDRQQGRLC